MLEASAYLSQKTRNNIYKVSCRESKVSSNVKALITDIKLDWDFRNYLTSGLILSLVTDCSGK